MKWASELQRSSAYRRASNPVFNIESIWQQYEIFERGLVDSSNSIFAKDSKETQPIALSNRTLARELQPLMNNLIQHNLLAIPPQSITITSTKQLQLWKRIIKWEAEQTSASIESVKRKYIYHIIHIG